VLHADDRGFLYGHGAFETVHVVEGRARALTRHIRRLRRACPSLSIPVPEETWTQLPVWVARTARQLDSEPEGVLHIYISRGRGHGARAPVTARPTCIISVAPTRGAALRRAGCDGLRVTIPAGPLAGWKTLAWLRSVLAVESTPDVDEGRPVEVLLADATGELLEGATTNLFAWLDGALCTPAADGRLLPGVAREMLIETARHRGVDVRERPLVCEDLIRSSAVLLTNATLPWAPLLALDGAPLEWSPPPALQATLRAWSMALEATA
jgi:branched-chain amino acid aminotransferase